jgi:hypothetical protein
MQKGMSNIGLDDRKQYLDDMMQKYMAGAGLSQSAAQGAFGMVPSQQQLTYGANSAGGAALGKGLGAMAGLAGSYMDMPSWSSTGD